MFLLKVIECLDGAGIKYAVAGGFAVALHGAVRGTLDVDLVIRHTEKDFVGAERALKDLGLASSLPVSATQIFQFRKEYVESRNLIAWSFSNPDQSSEIVDILLTEDLRKVQVRTLKYGRHRINIISIEDLMRMKEKTGRPQDQADVQALRIIKEKKR
jgi:hypothetical protein